MTASVPVGVGFTPFETRAPSPQACCRCVQPHAAALAAPSIRLAGELADGWVPFLWARSRLADGREAIAAARTGAPRRLVQHA